jgi:hypothetical protein
MKYVRYDATTGRITSVGDMVEANIDDLLSKGDTLIKTGDRLYPISGHRVDLINLEIVVDTVVPAKEPALKAAIRDELLRTDYTQAVDASEHILLEVQADWRDYRRALRAAHKLETFDSIIEALPPHDAQGLDQFERFRRLKTIPSPSVT